MKEYIKINIASPKKILKWTERLLPNGKLIGEVQKSVWKIKLIKNNEIKMNFLLKFQENYAY